MLLFSLQSYFLQTVQISMSQNEKRSLRERRVPKNFNSDEEDASPYDYHRHYYHKMRVDHSPEVKNPALQLNSEAKVLIKFINSINKNLKESKTLKKKGQEGQKELPDSQRDKKAGKEPLGKETEVKHGLSSKDIKTDTVKKQKQLYNFKAQLANTEKLKQSKNDLQLTKMKGITTQSAIKMLDLERHLQKSTSSLTHLQAVQATLKDLGQHQQLNGNLLMGDHSKNPFLNQGKSKSAQINDIEGRLGNNRPVVNEEKLFKRSAYHVAIAYHIYLKKLKEKGPITSEIDPTYHARKLRQNMGRNDPI